VRRRREKKEGKGGRKGGRRRGKKKRGKWYSTDVEGFNKMGADRSRRLRKG